MQATSKPQRKNAGKAAPRMDDEAPVMKKRRKNHRTRGSENQQHLEPEDDEEYVVERILAEKTKKGTK